ncbi:hypothetical protein ACF08N_37095 [Streptomyces sp. NPDC015127]|uniref:hypothetical protein n=1 Tax=Streptomyces sp. NPDC015127 TaxID=3364939 RepID=UPI0036F965A2
MAAKNRKTSGNVPNSDQCSGGAAKKIKGRKRYPVANTLGLALAVIVTAASCTIPPTANSSSTRSPARIRE